MLLSIFPLSPHHPRSTICCRGYRAALASAHQAQPLPQTLSVLDSTPQVKGMHTIIRYELRNQHLFPLKEKKNGCVQKLPSS